MPEFFVVTNSNGAPVFSDTGERYVEADSPEVAAGLAEQDYDHPAGLYSLRVWASADAYHKGEEFLAERLSARARSRTYGVLCPECNAPTELRAGNVEGGEKDAHECLNGHRVLVDNREGVPIGG